MSVLIIGANGSMGKRYQAILKHLGREFDAIDKGETYYAGNYEGFIIATPTETHAGIIKKLAYLKKPILVEKPISTDMVEVRNCIQLVRDEQTPLSMMLQYQHISSVRGDGESYYNYFRHGNDGIYWDCLQIIGLANGAVRLSDDSPVWRCVINGVTVPLRLMDFAYLAFVEGWFENPNQDLGRIHHMHEKTDAMARGAL